VTDFAILCSGQGEQHPQMFEKLRGSSFLEKNLRSASEMLGKDVATIPPEEWFENLTAQVLICAYTLSLWSELEPVLPKPKLFAGYSLGEMLTYGCAGSVESSQLFQLVKTRAALMNQSSDQASGLIALKGISQNQILEWCSYFNTFVAIANGTHHFVIGGAVQNLELLKKRALEKGASIHELPVSVAAHTPILQSATHRFKEALERAEFRAPNIPIVSCSGGLIVRERKNAIDSLASQLSTTIEWNECMSTLYESGCRILLELGPGKALTKMVRAEYPEIAVRGVEEFQSYEGASNWVKESLKSLGS
jgi:[acyl-carrier-protein] S-malonyltransferase